MSTSDSSSALTKLIARSSLLALGFEQLGEQRDGLHHSVPDLGGQLDGRFTPL
jgi:hypothetical protein